MQIIIVDDRPFGFDHVFGQSSTQEEVFEAIGRPLVDKMLSGFNCSLLAYGQSGNGKTYTMGLDGQSDIGKSAKDAGIIIRTLRSIFEAVHANEGISDLTLEVSFIEIYNERVYDLLSPTPTEAEKFKKLFTKRRMRNEADAQQILAEAYQRRHVRPTKINLTSSRSHAVFTIYATIKNSDFCSIHSELNLVDLAGAEGVRRTGHHGQALTEGVNINQGLLSVGRILQAIAKGEKVIPYRESVLTRVLQESLNRNCFLTLLACVSPSRLDTKETLSTLRFAENVGTLKNNPKINVIMNEITMARRKTPTKQMFTPRPTSTLKGSRATLTANNANTLQKKKLVFPHNHQHQRQTMMVNTSTTKKRAASGVYRPLSKIGGGGGGLTEIPATIGSRRPTEQDFSFGANISTSTFVDQTQTSYSPVIRQCMSTFESKLDERINAAVNDIASKLLLSGNSIMMGESQRTVSGAVEPKRRRTRNSYREGVAEEATFKVPHEVIQKGGGGGEDEEQHLNNTFDLTTDGLQFNSSFASETMVEMGETSILRRSRRVQELNESRLVEEEEERKQKKRLDEEKERNTKKQKNPRFLKNKYLASYFRLSTQLEAPEEGPEEEEEEEVRNKKKTKGGRVAQNTHSTEVLKILNNGNLKELQILPQIGLKTAYQIMTFR